MASYEVVTGEVPSGDVAEIELRDVEDSGTERTSTIEESTSVRRGLARTQSMKVVSDHLSDHKRKYGICCAISSAAIIIGCVLGIVAAVLHFKKGAGPSLTARLSANKGTSVEPVTIVPAKGASSSRRRLLDSTSGGSLLRRILIDAVDPKNFPETSDYNTAGDPVYIVSDRSADAVQIINTISCSVDQLRIADIGLNTSSNPKLLPYVSIVQDNLCSESTGATPWYVKSKGPAVFGDDGLYETDALFPMEGNAMHMSMTNNLVSGNIATSKIYFSSGSDVKGTLQLDFTSSVKTEVQFALELGGSLQSRWKSK